MTGIGTGRRWGTNWRLWVLVGSVLIAYIPLWHAGFVWDDDSLLTANPLIRDRAGLYQFWFTTRALDYWPVTSTSFWIEWRLWGLHPLGYHLTNLVLYLGTSLLLWALLRRLLIPGAWIASLVFALHPMNVESVTWIAERKNLLALLFYLGSIFLFLKNRSWLSLAAFLLAMLSKGSAATLPLVLCGIVLWRQAPASRGESALRLGKRELMRIAPFFVVAIILAAVDVWFQRHGRLEIIRTASWPERLAGAGAVILFYLYKSVWPLHLIFIYPQWQIRTAQLAWWLPLGAVLLITAVLALRSRASPFWRGVLYGWGFFCVALIPVLGLTDVYFMKFSLVADHYAQLALIAIAAGAGVCAEHWHAATPRRWRAGLAAMGVMVAVGLGALTWRQNCNYRSEETLYRSVLAANPDSWLAHGNLGMLLARSGDDAQARSEFESALRLKPDYAEALNNFGVLLAKNPRNLPEAIADYRASLQAKPDYALAHYNLAVALAALPGRESEAAGEYQAALQFGPANADWENDLAVLLAKLPGQWPAAIDHFRAAVALKPDDADLRYNLANHLMRSPEQLGNAIAQYEAAIRLRPNFAAARFNLGVAYGRAGQLNRAVAQFQRVIDLDPGNQRARQVLAAIQANRP